MDALIEQAKQLITSTVSSTSRPVVFWSGGKDSMVLLHLLRACGFRWPVILYRHPWFPHKYAFIDRIIREWQLTVFEYPPIRMGLKAKNHQVELVSFYHIGAPLPLHLPTNMLPVESAWDWRCGIELLNRPKGMMEFPWNTIYIGHKSCDVDVTEGSLALHTNVHQIPDGPMLIFPLREWSHEDVWSYTEHFHVPVQETRYERTASGWKERAEKTYNPDCTPICIRCMDYREGEMVECPLMGKRIPNISARMTYVPNQTFAYCGEPVDAVRV